ncbi:hypothetical protein WMQ87_004088 [Pseudomonas aeruginosa]|nr:hypothetical protein [Pseudomonas aeruginosa]MBG4375332.1 hypothetical protein [Pseudomonas aeruginosa]HBO3433157.1 hypothetical protein [Pseudomonas aeruginosa]HBP5136749.1 hypothetical protein [Pseudomonas aeruginosa]
MALAYTGNGERKADQLLEQVRQELKAIVRNNFDSLHTTRSGLFGSRRILRS